MIVARRFSITRSAGGEQGLRSCNFSFGRSSSLSSPPLCSRATRDVTNNDPEATADAAYIVGSMLAPGGLLRKGKAPRRPIVIGENMKRVVRYAEQIGAKRYRPWGMKIRDFDLSMRRNRAWIRRQIKMGREIIDIGPDFARRAERGASDFYEMERRALRDYGNRRKVFVRSGTQGGVPGLDF